MRKRLITLTLLGLLSLVYSLMPRPAVALSCLHPREQLPGIPLLVQGKVTEVKPAAPANTGSTDVVTIGGSKPLNITLAVERYFRGRGPAELHAVYDGMGWAEMSPVGSEIIMGFFEDPERGGYAAGPCSLVINVKPANPFEEEMLTLIKQQYGEGRAPDAEAPVPSPPGAVVPEKKHGTWILWTGMGALVLLVGGITLWRRSRNG